MLNKNSKETLLFANKKLSNEFGLTDKSKFIGAGAFGEVYTTPNKNRVVKITENLQEAQIARKLSGKTIPNVVKIFAVKRVVVNRQSFWLISMERLYPLTQWEKIKIGWSGEEYYRSADMRSRSKVVVSITKALKNLNEINIHHNDIHHGNVLKTKKNTYKVIDIM